MRQVRICAISIAILGLLISWPGRVAAQPAINYSNYHGSISGDVTTLTIPNVQVVGTNCGLAVCIQESATDSGVVVGGVTFNTSESLSEVHGHVVGERETSVWYLTNAPAVTGDVVITLSAPSGGGLIMATAIGLSNVAQSQPTLAGGDNCSDCDITTVILNTTVDNTLLFTCTKHSSHSANYTHGSGQIEISDFAEPGGGGERQTTSYEIKTIAGSETLIDDADRNGSNAMVAIGIEPIPVPGIGRRRSSPIILQ